MIAGMLLVWIDASKLVWVVDVLSMVALYHLANLRLLCSVLVPEGCARLVKLMVSTGGLVYAIVETLWL